MKFIEFDSLESTNRYCESLDLKDVEAFTVVWAHNQTCGLGQRGNAWHSAPGLNLTFSMVLHPHNLPAADQYNLTIQCSAAIAQHIESTLCADGCTSPVYIKWPNDIYIGRHKVCGTLIVNELAANKVASAICGIGLNVNETEFPNHLPNPTSLSAATGREYNLTTMLQGLCRKIKATTLHTPFEESMDYYLRHLYRKGIEADYLYNGQPLRATITGINRYGHLLLTTANNRSLSCQLKEIVFL
ncbi:MAG: biotin--[Bacteroidales bacterium]|nr:biotin--[acetyl-CoA-carboxylase] ligase [Bacteroidales bacterium]